MQGDLRKKRERRGDLGESGRLGGEGKGSPRSSCNEVILVVLSKLFFLEGFTGRKTYGGGGGD